MILSTKCKSCRTPIKFKARVSDRFDLAKKRGDKIELRCTSCGASKAYHVNDIKAQENKVFGILGLIIFLGGTTIIVMYFWPYVFQTSYIYAISAIIGIASVPFVIQQLIAFLVHHGLLLSACTVGLLLPTLQIFLKLL